MAPKSSRDKLRLQQNNLTQELDFDVFHKKIHKNFTFRRLHKIRKKSKKKGKTEEKKLIAAISGLAEMKGHFLHVFQCRK